MRTPRPVRKFVLELAGLACYAALFVWSFWVDVPQVEQIAGQVLSLLVMSFFGYFLFTERGQRKTLKPDKSVDLGDPAEQWRVFFQVVGIVAVLIVARELDLQFWSSMTILVPSMLLVFAAASIVLRPWFGKRRAERDQG